jgi:hypothetical protein
VIGRTVKEESELTLAVRELRDEVQAVREVLSELAEAAKWQNNNAEDYPALVHDRSSLWTLAEARLPKLIEEIAIGPDKPLLPLQQGKPNTQRDLY